jgi:hypothetical protein
MAIEYSTLVARFSSKRIMLETLKGWMTANFTKMLRYEPRSITLDKGSIVWIMSSKEDVN